MTLQGLFVTIVNKATQTNGVNDMLDFEKIMDKIVPAVIYGFICGLGTFLVLAVATLLYKL